ncbi:hypothetical protein PILCRDRAFT_814255 [Piloderma croceum F 1598]|uniref:HAUS augmin-like complex subunit 6 N-terminal domain-containing protein n=1 Tax=Piloderma croceum (strain F 1598) TaxID=765440 RepID=A0A0C3FV97_PILCF|nr:hypothetical protein PILCRDRAFT_814255 [Piloderma croceum F 1598]
MTEPVLAVPNLLLLLVHLHLLEYPSVNNPEYDQNLFDPNVRGLRDRVNSMENMSYFLVGKIEDRKASTNKILSTYPCLTPPDSIAFRTSLAKYLETLRHNSSYLKIGSSSMIASRNRRKGIDPEFVQAWWWKDIVVRKTLLEECAGERFERLLLALSTHALLKRTSVSLYVPANIALGNTRELFRVQQQTYTALLASSESTRHTWQRSAALLDQRQDNLKLLREHLASRSQSPPSKYDALPTDRLLTLADSMFQGFCQDFCDDVEDRRALNFTLELAGLSGTDMLRLNLVNTSPSAAGLGADFMSRDLEAKILPVQALPIAAAHHPSSLRNLRRSLFAPSKPSSSACETGVNAETVTERTKSHAEISLSVHLSAEKKTKSALNDALTQTQMMRHELRRQLTHAKQMQSNKVDDQTSVQLDLWLDVESEGSDVDFCKQPTPGLFSSPEIYEIPRSNRLECRVDHVRGSPLPVYPSISESLPSSLPPPPNGTMYFLEHSAYDAQMQDNVDKPLTADGSVDHTATPPRLITSTPPASVKPRSAYARRIIASQSKGTPKKPGKVEFIVSGSTGLRKSRKSVRTSLALLKRPSLFGPPLSDPPDEEHTDDADRIINAVHDESSRIENSYITPKFTRLPSPYKFKSASPSKEPSATPGPRCSFKIIERLSLASLPDGMMSADDLFQEEHSLDANDTNGDWVDADELPGVYSEPNLQDNGEEYEGRSVTLRDILLQAGDTTQFDLLSDEIFRVDGSFAWE